MKKYTALVGFKKEIKVEVEANSLKEAIEIVHEMNHEQEGETYSVYIEAGEEGYYDQTW